MDVTSKLYISLYGWQYNSQRKMLNYYNEWAKNRL